MPHRPSTRRGVALAVAIACTPLAVASSAPSTWLATWQASPQRVWSTDFLFPTHLPAVLRDQTVRQVARVSVGGSRLRIVVSNAYGEVPVRIGAVTVARPGADGAIIPGSLREVTFGGTTGATLLPGASLVSDPVALPIPARAQLAVSVYLPNATPMTTFHWDGRQTGWIVPGNQTSAHTLSGMDGDTVVTTARPLLSGIHVEANDAAKAVAVIGDSITDGATASMDADHRWPDFLAARLVPRGAAVVNAGISGARLLADGMGANALARLDRDVLAQPGVRSVIVLLGINDVAWPGTAFAPGATRPTLDDLVSGYRQFIAQAHLRGVRVIGTTLTPFEGALPGTPLADYYDPGKERLRQAVNAWIRTSDAFDAVLDADRVLRDPDRPSRLAARYDSGDHLHPGDDGNRAIAEAVDLDVLFDPAPDVRSARSAASRTSADADRRPPDDARHR